MMKFICKCEILKSFIILGRLKYNFKINCIRGLVSVFYLIVLIVDWNVYKYDIFILVRYINI